MKKNMFSSLAGNLLGKKKEKDKKEYNAENCREVEDLW